MFPIFLVRFVHDVNNLALITHYGVVEHMKVFLSCVMHIS